MSYLFTEDQKARIREARAQAQAGGSWAQAYELVASIVGKEPDATGAMPILDDPQVQASRLWLLGAAQANAGEGAFSSLIRNYTARQYELHFGVALTEQQGQEASDAVASEVLGTIVEAGVLQAVLPTVAQIAEQDATAVGEVLFDTRPTGEAYDDTAASDQANAAWSGSILFSFFDNGVVSSDETDRLLSEGEGDTALDSVNDLRDVLFAYDAFTGAAEAAGLAGSYLANVVDDTDVLWEMFEFGSLDDFPYLDVLDPGALLAGVTEGSAAGSAFSWVDHLGPDALLRSLESVLGESGGGSFVQRAHALFSGVKDAGQLDLRIQRIDQLAAGNDVEPGQPLPVDALVSAAQADTPEGRAVLFALHRGNPIVVLGRDGSETEALYAPFDLDVDNFSEQYLEDRATYLSQLHVEGVEGSDAGVDDAFLLDLATDNDVGVESPLVNRRVFGSDEGEPVWGARAGSSEDRLYGGRGDDIVQGFGGNDRLEGQQGDDILEGGVGHDTYAFQPGDGEDEIFDSDGEGEVLVAGEVLTGTDAEAEVRVDGAVWTASDGTTYTLLDGDLQSGGTLKIDEDSLDDGDAITISNFENGDLGIDLNPARGLAYSFDGTTPFGGGDGPADPELQLVEGRSRTFQVFTDRPAGAGDTLTLTLDAASAGDFVWHVTDGSTRAADTPLTLELTPGADHVSITLAHKGEIDGNLPVSVDAAYTSADGEALGSQALDITVVDGADDDPLPSSGQYFYGDLETEPDDDPDESGYQDVDVYGNRPTTGNAEPGREDVLFGSAGNDEMRGLEGTDVLNGRSGDDILRGGDGDDVLLAEHGHDVLVGGAGRDLLFGDAVAADGSSASSGNDRLYGEEIVTEAAALEAGNTDADSTEFGDLLSGFDGEDLLIAGNTRDALGGGDGDDRIYAGAGDDFIFGDGEVSGPVFIRPDTDDATDIANWNIDGLQWSASVTEVAERKFWLDWDHAGVADTAGLSGDDLIHAGKGNDYVKAGAGRDTVYGEAGNDLVFGEAGQDNLSGGDGDDLLVGDGGDAEPGEGAADWISGGAGDDEIFGGGGADALLGGADNDLIVGDLNDADAADDTLIGHAGEDTLIGGGADDTLLGGDHADILLGDAGTDFVSGDLHGRDLLFGGDGDDQLVGQGGDDWLEGGSGADVMHGDDASVDGEFHGRDVLLGGEGDDTLFGGGSDDRLEGEAGDDTLVGDDSAVDGEYHGSDDLYGGAGEDKLYGSGGSDWLQGDDGADLQVGACRPVCATAHAGIASQSVIMAFMPACATRSPAYVMVGA